MVANQRKVDLNEKTKQMPKNTPLESTGFQESSKTMENDRLFEKALAGSTRAFGELLEQEKSLLFDYALRMTGDIHASLDVIGEQLEALEVIHLKQCASLRVFRQALVLGVRRQLEHAWQRDTSRLENAAFLQSNPETENLKELGVPRSSKARDFDRELQHLTSGEREAIWLKARLGASMEEISQIMSLPLDAVKKNLVSALFRLENKSYGRDPESLVAELPMHPLPPPVSNVTVELSQVMKGIQKTQATGKGKGLIYIFLALFLIVSTYSMYEVFIRTEKDWLILKMIGKQSTSQDEFFGKFPESNSGKNQDQSLNGGGNSGELVPHEMPTP